MFENCDWVYHTWHAGEMFGLEDLIYRMPEEQVTDLVDGQINFCHFEVTVWDKRKFSPTKHEDTKLFTLDLWEHMQEWQQKFPAEADALFSMSLIQLQTLLSKRI